MYAEAAHCSVLLPQQTPWHRHNPTFFLFFFSAWKPLNTARLHFLRCTTQRPPASNFRPSRLSRRTEARNGCVAFLLESVVLEVSLSCRELRGVSSRVSETRELENVFGSGELIGGRNHGEEDALRRLRSKASQLVGPGVPESRWALGLGVRRGRRKRGTPEGNEGKLGGIGSME